MLKMTKGKRGERDDKRAGDEKRRAEGGEEENMKRRGWLDGWCFLTRDNDGPCGVYTSDRPGSDALGEVCRFRSDCTPSSLRSPENSRTDNPASTLTASSLKGKVSRSHVTHIIRQICKTCATSQKM